MLTKYTLFVFNKTKYKYYIEVYVCSPTFSQINDLVKVLLDAVSPLSATSLKEITWFSNEYKYNSALIRADKVLLQVTLSCHVMLQLTGDQNHNILSICPDQSLYLKGLLAHFDYSKL